MNTQKTSFTSYQMNNLIETQTFSNRSITQGLLIVGVVLSILMFFSTSQAQTFESEVVTESAIAFMQKDDFQSAIIKLGELNGEEQPAAVDHLKGVCHFHLQQYDEALEFLFSAVENMVDEAEEWDPSTGQAPLHSEVYLGRALMAAGNFADAEYHLSQFMVSLYMMDDSEQWLMTTVEDLINECRLNGSPERTANL